MKKQGSSDGKWWWDEVYNPWTNPAKFAGDSSGRIGGFAEDCRVGDPNQVVTWNLEAREFAKVMGRRRRVFAGPWCRPFEASLGVERARAFMSLVMASPELVWVLPWSPSGENDPGLLDMCAGAENVCVAMKLLGSASANRDLGRLRRLTCEKRMVLVTSALGDLGEVELDGIDWAVVLGEGTSAADDEASCGFKLQAMAYGVPVWFDLCQQNSSAFAGLPLTVREQPGWG